MSALKLRHWQTLFSSSQRLEESRGHAHSAQSSSRLDKEVQIPLTETQTFSMATEARVSVGTITEECEAIAGLKECLNQSERKRIDLEETLAIKEWVTGSSAWSHVCGVKHKNIPLKECVSFSIICVSRDELTQLKTKQEELQKEADDWKAEQKSLLEKEREQHKYVVITLLFKKIPLGCYNRII